MRTVAERLQDMRAELRGDIAEDASFLARDPEERGEDLTPSQHPADVASDLYAREQLVADEAVLARELRDVEDALHRIADGTYGLCIDCRRPISPDRLAARPHAARCIGCQQRLERRRSS